MPRLGERPRRDWASLIKHIKTSEEQKAAEERAAARVAARSADPTVFTSYGRYDQRPEATEVLGYVFVALITELSGDQRLLGVFPDEGSGWSALEGELSEWGEDLVDALTLTRWCIGHSAEEEGAEQIVGHVLREHCPLCDHRTMLLDVMNKAARCRAEGCGAYIIPNETKPGKVDAGWPQGHQMAFAIEFDAALQALRAWGAPTTLAASAGTGADTHETAVAAYAKQLAPRRQRKMGADDLLGRRPDGPKLGDS